MTSLVRKSLIVFLCLSVLTGCSGPDFSTPRSTVTVAIKSTANQEWEKVYRSLHPEFQDLLIKKLRNGLKTGLQYRSPNGLTEDDVEKMSDKDLFSALMKSLIRLPKYKKQLKNYHSAKIKKVKQKSKTRIVTLKSDQPLPVKHVIVILDDGLWKIWGTRRFAPEQSNQ